MTISGYIIMQYYFQRISDIKVGNIAVKYYFYPVVRIKYALI